MCLCTNLATLNFSSGLAYLASFRKLDNLVHVRLGIMLKGLNLRPPSEKFSTSLGWALASRLRMGVSPLFGGIIGVEMMLYSLTSHG